MMKNMLEAVVATMLIMTGAHALPPGFVEEIVIDDLTGPGGIAFGPNGIIYLWEYDGRVWVVEGGSKQELPLLDIRDEVNTFWTRGFTGLALDPEFETNGYMYLMYTVDWEWYSTEGNPNPALLDTFRDTFGRLTRYTLDSATDFTTIVPDSRWEMIGDSHDNGFPVTFASHTQNTIVFAEDGTMLLSAGDGASMLEVDTGGPRNPCCSSNTAEIDGIIGETEQVGAYRAQLVNSHSGKILRIDPATAHGVPANPFYDDAAPDAPRSRVWLLGLRNPYRFAVRPGTGTTGRGATHPGVLFVGDVGWDNWERLVVAQDGGQNFGWPVFEGLNPAAGYPGVAVANLDAPNPLAGGGACPSHFNFTDLIVQETLDDPSFPNPCDPEQQIPDDLTFENTRAVLAWRNSRVFPTPLSQVPIFLDGGFPIAISVTSPTSPVSGEHLGGVATVGGDFYAGDKWPAEYHGDYFFGDAADGWIACAMFDDDHALIEFSTFYESAAVDPVWINFDPDGYAMYVTNYAINPSGITNPISGGGDIRRIVVDCNGNGVGDDTDITTGFSLDENGNGMPDECDPATLGDLDEDGDVDFADLLALLSNWGPCNPCPEDLDESGSVGFSDLLILLSNWS